MLRSIYIIGILSMLAACGGGGSSSNNDGGGDPPPDPVQQFSLGGTAKGLNGSITIANGDDQLTLTDNGTFTFANKLDASTRYDVRIVSLPDQQLCELQNSRSFITRDRSDLVVECASMVEVQVNINKPDAYQLTELRLVSNYGALGGVGEPALGSGAQALLAFDNTFVSLRNSDNKLVYIAFIDDINSGNFTVSSFSTAQALVLLEPTVSSAIQDRGLSVSDILDDLVIALNVDNDLDTLSNQIAALAESRTGLADGAASLTALPDVILKAVEFLNTVAPKTVNATNVSIQQLTVVSSESVSEQAGIEFSFEKVNNQNDIVVSASNQRNRYVTLTSQTFEDVLLAPEKDTQWTLEGGLGSQQTVDIAILGPGKNRSGMLSDTQAFYNASAASALNLYLFPSIKTVLGLANPAQFNLSDCIGEQSIDLLTEDMLNSSAITAYLDADNYLAAFIAMNNRARNGFLNGLSGNETPIDELFSCEKFGAGVVIDSQKSIAIDNVSTILATVNGIFDSDTGLNNLFQQSAITRLVTAIDQSWVETVWSLSNVLQLSIDADATEVMTDATVNFTGNCTNPNNSQPIPCTIDWQFGDGDTASGTPVQHAYAAAGNYTVIATATDSDNATHTQQLVINVSDPEPDIAVVTTGGTEIEQDTNAHDFSGVMIGESSNVILRVRNVGTDNLTINSVTSDNSEFTVLLTGTEPITPNSQTDLSITFTPAIAGQRTANIAINSDDPDESAFDFTVSGVGIADNTLGQWSVVKNSQLSNYSIQRATPQLDNSQNILRLRLFAETGVDYPQLNLTLHDYDASAAGNGDGIYTLDDNGSNSCQGFFAEQDDISASYCTRTEGLFENNSYSGSVTIRSVDADTKAIDFNFTAVRADCFTDIQQCENVSVVGTVTIDDPI